MRRIVLLCFALLLVAVVAWSEDAKPQWWQGEGPGRIKAPARDTVAGKVTAVSSTSINIETRLGVVAFAVTSDTKVRVGGAPASIDAVKVGDPVMIKFTSAADGSKVAVGIMVGKPQVAGEITKIDGNNLTIATRDGRTLTVVVGSDTKITFRQYVGSVADLAVGFGVDVKGQTGGDTIQATEIKFRPEMLKGIVQSVSGNTVVVKTVRQKTVNVTVGPSTIILVRPRTADNYKGTIADVKPNTAVNIGGKLVGDGAMNAYLVDVLVGGPENPGTSGGPTKAPGHKANKAGKR